VAHRTLLARRLDNGAYDVHRLRDRPAVDPDDPVVTALSFDAVFDHVEWGLDERVVVSDGTRTTYLAVPLSVPTADDLCPAGGACVALRPEAGLSEEYVRGWVHAAKEILGDAIERGWLREREALATLEERVRAFEGTTEVIVPEGGAF
jgi:hypothetical protein